MLPLTVIAGDSRAPLLAAGLTDDLITTLGQLRRVRVTAETSVARFQGTRQPIALIARQLGVEQVLEGTVAVQPGPEGLPGRVRVNARLIMAGTDLEIGPDRSSGRSAT